MVDEHVLAVADFDEVTVRTFAAVEDADRLLTGLHEASEDEEVATDASFVEISFLLRC